MQKTLTRSIALLVFLCLVAEATLPFVPFTEPPPIPSHYDYLDNQALSNLGLAFSKLRMGKQIGSDNVNFVKSGFPRQKSGKTFKITEIRANFDPLVESALSLSEQDPTNPSAEIFKRIHQVLTTNRKNVVRSWAVHMAGKIVGIQLIVLEDELDPERHNADLARTREYIHSIFPKPAWAPGSRHVTWIAAMTPQVHQEDTSPLAMAHSINFCRENNFIVHMKKNWFDPHSWTEALKAIEGAEYEMEWLNNDDYRFMLLPAWRSPNRISFWRTVHRNILKPLLSNKEKKQIYLKLKLLTQFLPSTFKGIRGVRRTFDLPKNGIVAIYATGSYLFKDTHGDIDLAIFVDDEGGSVSQHSFEVKFPEALSRVSALDVVVFRNMHSPEFVLLHPGIYFNGILIRGTDILKKPSPKNIILTAKSFSRHGIFGEEIRPRVPMLKGAHLAMAIRLVQQIGYLTDVTTEEINTYLRAGFLNEYVKAGGDSGRILELQSRIQAINETESPPPNRWIKSLLTSIRKYLPWWFEKIQRRPLLLAA